MEFPDYYYSGFDWTAFACTACRIRLLAMQVEIQGDFVLSLHDCHAMPPQLTLVPNYLVANWLGIQNSSLAIILPAMFQPLGVFLIRQQIQDFPQETLEAARLDGASEYRIYRSIVKPNLSSAIAAALILIFIDNWNIVDQAVIFLREPYQQPLSVYLCQILEEQPDIFYAASVFYAVPVLLIFLMGQDYLIQGISMSGVKA